ncbi:unnamed protein product [Vitrella brassicaformis CCMP3155]|uniref:Uncharacterized protein n=5 Tax=Vitrella brassicaformis TaxID=1169539 RepID=A0A0G4F742_VITBC|nr:unnamed protein product [Vitrella brassicaformis CCMP3155]|eukprot:CEM08053.1 unnamed protein product [Vitrella brassicaformis CCMP3155]
MLSAEDLAPGASGGGAGEGEETLSEDWDGVCHICFHEWDEEDHQMLQTECCGKNLCSKCFEDCQTKLEAVCPFCRAGEEEADKRRKERPAHAPARVTVHSSDPPINPGITLAEMRARQLAAAGRGAGGVAPPSSASGGAGRGAGQQRGGGQRLVMTYNSTTSQDVIQALRQRGGDSEQKGLLYKTTMCRYHPNCNRMDECHFAHNERELRDTYQNSLYIRAGEDLPRIVDMRFLEELKRRIPRLPRPHHRPGPMPSSSSSTQPPMPHGSISQRVSPALSTSESGSGAAAGAGSSSAIPTAMAPAWLREGSTVQPRGSKKKDPRTATTKTDWRASKPCHFWKEGKCRSGDACPFYHGYGLPPKPPHHHQQQQQQYKFMNGPPPFPPPIPPGVGRGRGSRANPPPLFPPPPHGLGHGMMPTGMGGPPIPPPLPLPTQLEQPTVMDDALREVQPNETTPEGDDDGFWGSPSPVARPMNGFLSAAGPYASLNGYPEDGPGPSGRLNGAVGGGGVSWAKDPLTGLSEEFVKSEDKERLEGLYGFAFEELKRANLPPERTTAVNKLNELEARVCCHVAQQEYQLEVSVTPEDPDDDISTFSESLLNHLLEMGMIYAARFTVTATVPNTKPAEPSFSIVHRGRSAASRVPSHPSSSSGPSSEPFPPPRVMHAPPPPPPPQLAPSRPKRTGDSFLADLEAEWNSFAQPGAATHTTTTTSDGAAAAAAAAASASEAALRDGDVPRVEAHGEGQGQQVEGTSAECEKEEKKRHVVLVPVMRVLEHNERKKGKYGFNSNKEVMYEEKVIEEEKPRNQGLSRAVQRKKKTKEKHQHEKLMHQQQQQVDQSETGGGGDEGQGGGEGEGHRTAGSSDGDQGGQIHQDTQSDAALAAALQEAEEEVARLQQPGPEQDRPPAPAPAKKVGAVRGGKGGGPIPPPMPAGNRKAEKKREKRLKQKQAKEAKEAKLAKQQPAGSSRPWDDAASRPWDGGGWTLDYASESESDGFGDVTGESDGDDSSERESLPPLTAGPNDAGPRQQQQQSSSSKGGVGVSAVAFDQDEWSRRLDDSPDGGDKDDEALNQVVQVCGPCRKVALSRGINPTNMTARTYFTIPPTSLPCLFPMTVMPSSGPRHHCEFCMASCVSPTNLICAIFKARDAMGEDKQPPLNPNSMLPLCQLHAKQMIYMWAVLHFLAVRASAPEGRWTAINQKAFGPREQRNKRATKKANLEAASDELSIEMACGILSRLADEPARQGYDALFSLANQEFTGRDIEQMLSKITLVKGSQLEKRATLVATAVRFLLSAGYSLTTTDEDGDTFLRAAARAKNATVLHAVRRLGMCMCGGSILASQ